MIQRILFIVHLEQDTKVEVFMPMVMQTGSWQATSKEVIGNWPGKAGIRATCYYSNAKCNDEASDAEALVQSDAGDTWQHMCEGDVPEDASFVGYH